MLNLQFLKLGGSLITDKTRPHMPRLDVLRRLASEIARARTENPQLALVVGHGAGSFGHVPASKYGTRDGVHTPEEWNGFAEVWREQQALNRLVLDALAEEGLPVLGLSPLASLTAQDGQVLCWDLWPLSSALQAGLIPLVYGDVIFDTIRGGTILSTEDQFAYLAGKLEPRRILLAGIEPGVWADYPACTKLITEITPVNFVSIARTLGGSAATDVTGGMASKVALSLDLVKTHPGLEVRIFSGEIPGMLTQALAGASVGTRIHNP
jgi:isopentenyl phosphate kinase